MSTSLIFLLIFHTYAALFAGVFFYLVLLGSTTKHGIQGKSLYAKSLLGLIFSLLTWGSGVFLRSHFSGKLGGATDTSITSLIPFFSLSQAVLLPSMALVSLVLFLIILKKQKSLGKEHSNAVVLVRILSLLGFLTAAGLMFLGVLLP